MPTQRRESRTSENNASSTSLAYNPTRHASNRAPNLIGTSSVITKIKELIGQVAPTDMTVLITGESGVGKEEIARLIHQQSKRAATQFTAINCAAFPAELIESELFGHERGAFTGATARRIGKLEAADGSTLLLDEICEMPLTLQVKLLRVIQEREIQRLGSNHTHKINVRIIAATNRRIAEELAAGRFRCDLYYRLQACEINVPPLRARCEDMRELVTHFAVKFADGREPAQFTEEALEALARYEWPGNVRELANAVEYAVNIHAGEQVCVGDLPESVREFVAKGEGKCVTVRDQDKGENTLPLSVLALAFNDTWHNDSSQLRRSRIEAAKRKVDQCGGNKSRAAKQLGISRQWLYKVLDEANS